MLALCVAAGPLQSQQHAAPSPTAAAAESPTAEITLAADPECKGPAAWCWVRENVLPSLDAWPSDLNPHDAIRIHVSRDHLEIAPAPATPPAPPDSASHYLHAELRIPVTGTLRVTGDVDGREEWTGKVHATPARRLGHLLRTLGVTAAPGPLELDVAALVAAVDPLHVDADATSAQLALAAAHCGVVTLQLLHTSPTLRVVGRSDGGLLLPALLLVAADARAPIVTAAGPTGADHRWLVRARCARGFERTEAARQLAISDDPRAAEALADLLLADPWTRATAISALVRRREAEALPDVLAAAAPDAVLTEPLAEAALWQLLPPPSPARAAVLRSLAGHDSETLRTFPARLAQWRQLGAARTGTQHPGVRPSPDRSAAIHWLSGTAVLIAALLLWRRRHGG
ncbi:MAG: hypothetical protein AAF628_17365 [Planctomycetota bacterium]